MSRFPGRFGGCPLSLRVKHPRGWRSLRRSPGACGPRPLRRVRPPGRAGSVGTVNAVLGVLASVEDSPVGVD